MRVVVTGHLGYVGAVLTPMLRAVGYEAFGIDADLYRRCHLGAALPPTPSLERDIRDVESGDFDRADAVIHLAALSNDPLGFLDPALTHAINHHAAVRVAECARAAGVRRIVLASSCSVYGGGGEGWLDENSPTHPLTPYAESKLAMERDILPMNSEGFRVVALRNATAFGPSPRLRFDLVVNNFVAWASATGRLVLKSDGSAWRPLVHVEDIARAALRALDAPAEALASGVFNVGRSLDNIRIADLAERVCAALPGATLERTPGADADTRCYRVRCDRLAGACPPMCPVRTIEEGVAGVADACRAGAFAPGDFEGPRFARLEHVRWLLARGMLNADLRWA